MKKIIRYDDPRVAGRDSNTILDENWWALLSGESRRGIAILRRSDSSFHSVEIMFTTVRSIREFEQRLQSR